MIALARSHPLGRRCCRPSRPLSGDGHPAHACMLSNGVLLERHIVYHHPQQRSPLALVRGELPATAAVERQDLLVVLARGRLVGDGEERDAQRRAGLVELVHDVVAHRAGALVQDRVRGLRARKLLGWPRRCKLAHTFRWEYC